MPRKSVNHSGRKAKRSTPERVKAANQNTADSVPNRSKVSRTHENANLVVQLGRSNGALGDREDLFAKAFRFSPHPIGITELDTGRCLDVNDACLDLFGFCRDEVVGQTTLMLGIWPDPRERAKFIERLKAEGSVRNYELTMRTKNGALRQFLVSSELITVDGRPCLVTVGNDITEQKRAEEALHRAHEELELRVAERTAELTRANERLQAEVIARKQTEEALREREALTRAFLDSSATVAWMKDAEGRHVYISPSFERRFNVRLEDWRGRTDFELWPRDIAERFRENDVVVLKENRVIEVVEQAQEADGGRSWWLSHKFPFRDASGKQYVGGLGVDITDRKRAEEALRESEEALRRNQDELRAVAGQLLSAQDDERKRIARELHDDYNQRLAALAVDLQVLSQSLPASLSGAHGQLSAIQKHVDVLSDDVHELAYQLHPPLLDEVGLEVALRDLVTDFGRREQVAAIFAAHDLPHLIPKAVASCLYRVAQESLRNAATHGTPSKIIVKLTGSPQGLGLSVQDDGKGFEPRQANPPSHRGLGLISMEERLRLLNGAFAVRSRPGYGTKVCAWIPLTGAA
jgi:PAS domain S-box-containing protein